MNDKEQARLKQAARAFSRMGNAARNASLSPEERKRLAQKAAATRWKKPMVKEPTAVELAVQEERNRILSLVEQKAPGIARWLRGVLEQE